MASRSLTLLFSHLHHPSPELFHPPTLKLCTTYILTPRASFPQPRETTALLLVAINLTAPGASHERNHSWLCLFPWSGFFHLVSCLPGSTLWSHVSEFHVAAFPRFLGISVNLRMNLYPWRWSRLFSSQSERACGLWVASQLTGTHGLPRGMTPTAARLVGSAGVEASLGSGSTASIACILLPSAHLCTRGFHGDSSTSHSSSPRWLNACWVPGAVWGAGGTVR